MDKLQTLEVMDILWKDFTDTSKTRAEQDKALRGINSIIKFRLGENHPLVRRHYQIIGKEETGWKFQLETNLTEIKKLFK